MAKNGEEGHPYRRIATEEAWISPELLALYQKMLKEHSSGDPGFESLWTHYGLGTSERCIDVRERMLDLGERRIRDMDAAGIDMQLLLLTTPGVQLFDPATAISLAAASNDQVSEAVQEDPYRFAALAAVAPQAPEAAAKELERCVARLKLTGAVINSHTRGEYLNDRKFWPIFEAAEALDVPIYVHPNTPPREMIGPIIDARP
jgi:5-carboxyvanillate decarboxylase